MVCEYCRTLMQGRCEHCGRVKLGNGKETNEFKTQREQEYDLGIRVKDSDEDT